MHHPPAGGGDCHAVAKRRDAGRREPVLRGGLDYYAPGTLYGHDTAYSPDGQNVNPRDGFGWSDADAAIEQPGLVGRVMAGLRYRF